MAMAFGSNSCVLLALTLFLAMEVAWGRRLDDDLVVTWGDGRGNISRDGQLLTLSLNKTGGSGFQSNKTFVYVRLDVQIKLVSGNSAGTVATFYLISEGPWDTHDEIDLEFLGNVTGQPYTLHTNVFCNGIGGKEQQFHLWFDPAADFHTYSIVWTSQHILILVDGVPIREFKNHGAKGLPFPTSQPMRAMGSLWNADDWATQGGRVKTDWTQEPFAVYYRNFTATAAPAGGGYASPAYDQEMDATAQKSLKWARDNCMVYDYCKDEKRLRPPNTNYPPECSLP